MRCDNCGAYASRAANNCRNCGAALRNLRLPVKRASAYPTLWKQAAPVLARGVALVALGVIAEATLTALAKGAFRLPTRRRTDRRKPVPTRRNGDIPEGSYAMSETVVMRRFFFRR